MSYRHIDPSPGHTTPDPRSDVEPEEGHGRRVLHLNAGTALPLKVLPAGGYLRVLPTSVRTDASHANTYRQPTELRSAGRSYGFEASTRCDGRNDMPAWAARNPGECKRMRLTDSHAYGNRHPMCAPPGLSQECGGAAALLHKEDTSEAELVLQLKALTAQVHEPMCSAIKDSLYRLSRHAAAREAGQSDAATSAPMDSVVANLLFNSF